MDEGESRGENAHGGEGCWLALRFFRSCSPLLLGAVVEMSISRAVERSVLARKPRQVWLRRIEAKSESVEFKIAVARLESRLIHHFCWSALFCLHLLHLRPVYRVPLLGCHSNSAR